MYYSPVRHSTHPKTFSCDLHVLGMPPAFVLSQDQTLTFKSWPVTVWNTFDHSKKLIQVTDCLLIKVSNGDRLSYQGMGTKIQQPVDWFLFSVDSLFSFQRADTAFSFQPLELLSFRVFYAEVAWGIGIRMRTQVVKLFFEEIHFFFETLPCNRNRLFLMRYFFECEYKKKAAEPLPFLYVFKL